MIDFQNGWQKNTVSGLIYRLNISAPKPPQTIQSCFCREDIFWCDHVTNRLRLTDSSQTQQWAITISRLSLTEVTVHKTGDIYKQKSSNCYQSNELTTFPSCIDYIFLTVRKILTLWWSNKKISLRNVAK